MRHWGITILFCLSGMIVQAADLPRPVAPDTFGVPGATSVLLGRDLFFDPILSGNRNIACAQCHNPDKGSADARALPFGEGVTADGGSSGSARRIARHSPALFNLGAAEFTTLMHDGRVTVDPAERFGFRLPAPAFLERPVTSALAAQALMPIVAPNEMAGQPGSNPIADAVARGQITGMGGAWYLIAQRIADVPEYRERFAWLIGPDEPLHATHIAQALADFIAFEFRATDSAFDAFMRGADDALSNEARHGLALFYGKAGCASCHAGPFQTDHDFHALGLPQIGPGKAHGRAGADHGRAAVTNRDEDAYRFRTPSLRNVALTAPYGHTGAYDTLEQMIRHHLDPLTSLAEYMPAPDLDPGAMADFDEVLAIGAAIDIAPVSLTSREIAALISFLDSLTDTSFRDQRLGPPDTVPSGLPVSGIAAAPS